MKRLELSVPVRLLDDLGILSERFFRHNAGVEVLQSFSVRPHVAALIVRVRRHGPFKDPAAVRREASAIARRYRVERFEILSTDPDRGEYVAWIEWTLPRILRGRGEEGWSGVVPLEVVLSGPKEARVVLLASEAALPRLRTFLDDVGAPYRVRTVRTAAAETWRPLASLTGRQRDLLELAFRLGYYASPSRASLAQIASLIGISKAAVSKHLRAAERKLVAAAIRPPA
jgi:DNA-binding CsgD family transcriptional regulator